LKSPRIKVSGEFGKSSGKKVRARLKIQLNVSDRRGVDIEEMKREKLLEIALTQR